MGRKKTGNTSKPLPNRRKLQSDVEQEIGLLKAEIKKHFEEATNKIRFNPDENQ